MENIREAVFSRLLLEGYDPLQAFRIVESHRFTKHGEVVKGGSYKWLSENRGDKIVLLKRVKV